MIRLPAVSRAFRVPMRIAICAFAVLVATAYPGFSPAADSSPPAEKKSAVPAAALPSVDRFFDATVKLNVRAITNARSSATIGPEREGTGIVIGENGLILTICYLIVEADEV